MHANFLEQLEPLPLSSKMATGLQNNRKINNCMYAPLENVKTEYTNVDGRI